MERLTFEIDSEMKRQFLMRMVSEGRKSIKVVLTELCQQYIEFGGATLFCLLLSAARAAVGGDLEPLKKVLQEIDES